MGVYRRERIREHLARLFVAIYIGGEWASADALSSRQSSTATSAMRHVRPLVDERVQRLGSMIDAKGTKTHGPTPAGRYQNM